jgi:hypothetical protein
MPCTHIFDQEPKEYRLSVLLRGAPILSVEGYGTSGWGKYAHEHVSISCLPSLVEKLTRKRSASPRGRSPLLTSKSRQDGALPTPRRLSTSTRSAVRPRSSRPSTPPSKTVYHGKRVMSRVHRKPSQKISSVEAYMHSAVCCVLGRISRDSKCVSAKWDKNMFQDVVVKPQNHAVTEFDARL